MAKRLKFKISRVFSFQSCRSKDPSTLPANPAPPFSKLSPYTPNSTTLYFPPPPPSKPHYSSLKRHVSSAFSSMGCGLGSRSRSSLQYYSDSDYTESPPPPTTPEFHWEKDHKWHVIAKQTHESESPRVKIADSSENDGISLPPPPPPNTERKKRRQRKKKTTTKIRFSTSSWESGSGLFSSESFDDEETETLVSPSRSFSTDSGGRRHKKPKRKVRRCVFKETARISSTSESESPARLSMFLQKMIPCAVEGKVRESFAVVKKSEDPYEDFKRSMTEMILEKQIFEVKDLEQLLQCFLSLNSRDHHGIIVQAFSEIWEALFCARSASFSSS